MRGQVYITSTNALGTGSITLGGIYLGSFVGSSTPLDVFNPFVFGHDDALAFSTGGAANPLTLHSLSATNPSGVASFGRSGTTAGDTVILKLDDEESGALNAMRLRGYSTLKIDGGTLKARSTAFGDFFRKYDDGANPNIVVTRNGFTFDAAEGADVSLGFSPALTMAPLVTTSAVETVEAYNCSFETNADGWSGKEEGNGNGIPGRKADNDGTWADTSYNSPYGSYVYTIRCKQSFSLSDAHALTVGTTGDWFVNFVYAVRKSVDESRLIDTTVTLTDVDDKTVQSAVLPHTGVKHDYIEALVGPFALVAGHRYTIKIATGEGDASGYSALDYDHINLQRLQVTTNRTTLAKTGAGKLAIAGLTGRDGVLSVTGGSLDLTGPNLTDERLSVAAGATLGLYQPTCSEGASTVDVASGATLVLSDQSANLVVNPTFENDGKIVNLNGTAGRAWSHGCFIANNQNSNGTDAGGLQGNTGNISPKGPWTTSGTVTAAVREGAYLSQVLNVPKGGTARLSFVYARRAVTTKGMRLLAKIDDTVLTGDGLEPSDTAFARFTCDVSLTAGKHTLRFEVTGDDGEDFAGPMALIDDVSLRMTGAGALDLSAVTIRLASGSTLELGNAEPLSVPNLLVDGVRINGRNSALRKAGVTVTGSGKILAGDGRAEGLCILFK